MTRSELQQIAGSRLSDEELVAAALEDNFLLRGTIKEAAEVIHAALLGLGWKRNEPYR